METVMITGGTGMVGKHLTELLVVKGYDVIIVSRKKVIARRHASISYALWDVEKQTIDADALQRTDFIINLAGAGVAEKRWSDKRKQEIVSSRTNAGATIAKVLETMPNKVKCVVNASAIGWYGADTKDSLLNGFTEDKPADSSFLGNTCKQLEESVEPVTKLGIRLIKLRIGIVLSNAGGALVEFKKPIKNRIAAILGNGKQVISWIHIEDLCRMFAYCIEKTNTVGVYNAVAPMPVTNKELTIKLAKLMKGTGFFPMNVPSFLLKMILGEMSIEVLKSTRVSASKIMSLGFVFKFPTINEALKDLIEA